MDEPKNNPKCSGKMLLGYLKEKGNFGNSPYEWSPSDDAPFPVKGVPSKCHDIVLYRCEQCGFVELYTQPR